MISRQWRKRLFLLLVASHGCFAWTQANRLEQRLRKQQQPALARMYRDCDQDELHDAAVEQALGDSLVNGNDKSPSLLETSLGDIMKSSYQNAAATADAAAAASSLTSLASRYNVTHPMDRILLTANGNVQRLVSSYHDAPVRVIVRRFIKVQCEGGDNGEQAATTKNTTASFNDSSPPLATFERLVELQVYGRIFCVASSTVTIYDQDCLRLMESNQVGLGQLFQHYHVLPEFTLLNAGPSMKESSDITTSATANMNDENVDTDNESSATTLTGFWRNYRLDCRYLSCRIQERFSTNVWELQQHGQASNVLSNYCI